MDNKFYLLVGLAIAVLTAGYLFFRSSTYTPASKAGLGRVQKKMEALNKEFNPNSSQDIKTRRSLVDRLIDLPVIGLGERKRLEIAHALDAIEWRPENNVAVEDVYFMMITNAIITAAASIIAALFWRPFLLGLLFVFVTYNIPVSNLTRIMSEDEKQITYEFPDFYDIVYVQYREHETNVILADVVDQYLPVAGPAFRNMLRRFAMDLPSGEDFALERLDKRYQHSRIVHRFSSVMRQRLKGEEASFVAMDHLRESLQADVRDWMLNDLEKRKAVAGRCTGILTMVILSVVMIVYFICFFRTTTGM